MKPSIGRIVHYVTASGVHVPAIITRVEEDSYKVDMVAFCTDSEVLLEQGPGGTLQSYPVDEGVCFSGTAPVLDVMNDDGSKITGTWHWPEREYVDS